MTDAGAPPSESTDAAALPPPSGTGSLIWSLFLLGTGLALALLRLEGELLLWAVWLIAFVTGFVRAVLWVIAWSRPLLWASLVLRVLTPIVAFSLAGSGLPLRIDEWRTREVRERLAPRLFDSATGVRDEPDWPYGRVEVIDHQSGNYVFFQRADRLIGESGYAYAPAGDIGGCPDSTFPGMREQRLSERWFWIDCDN